MAGGHLRCNRAGRFPPAGDPSGALAPPARRRRLRGRILPSPYLRFRPFSVGFGAMERDNDWMAPRKCREQPPATFFPNDGVGVEVAKRICADCPVSEVCLEYALENRIDHGVWGGTSERQRRRILKARRLPLLLGER